MSYPWNTSVSKTREYLKLHLFRVHPSLKEITEDFFSAYDSFRMIDLEALKSSMPLTLPEFKLKICEQIKSKKETVINKWLQSCAFKINEYQGVVEDLVTYNSDLVINIKDISF